MNAVVSGSAGVALVVDGPRLYSIDVASGQVSDRRPEEYGWLFGGVRDYFFLDDVTHDDVCTLLRQAYAGEQALRLFLILQDPTLPLDIRRDAVAELDHLVTESTADGLLNVVCAASAPHGMDLTGALDLAAEAQAPAVHSLLKTLMSGQPFVTSVCESWERLPTDLFTDVQDRLQARGEAVRAGVFRFLVSEVARSELTILSLPTLLALTTHFRPKRNWRKLLATWIAPITTERATRAPAVTHGHLGVVDPPTRQDDEGALLRPRHRPRVAKPKGSGARTSKVLDELFQTFRLELQDVTRPDHHETITTKLVDDMVRRLEGIQAGRESRPYLIMSLTRLATLLRDHNQKALSHKVLAYQIERNLADLVTCSVLVDAYGKAGDVLNAKAVFEHARAVGIVDDGFMHNSLLNAFGKAGDLMAAVEVFDQACAAGVANTVTYTSLLDAYGKAGHISKAREVFERARAAGVATDATYNALLDAYGKTGELTKAQEVFDEARAAGLLSIFICTSLLDAYGKVGDLGKAEEVFDEARGAGLLSPYIYNSLLDAYGKAGDPTRAQEVFDKARAAGLLSPHIYNSLLDAYGKAGDLVKAQEVFEEARAAGFTGPHTYNALLHAYGKAGDLVKAQRVFDEARVAGALGPHIYTSLLDAYGKAGHLAKAQEVFDQARVAELAVDATYTSLLDAYGKAGHLARAQEVFDEARVAEVAVGPTYTALLDAYGKAGYLAKAQEVFDEARATGVLSPFSYTALLDAHGKAGDVAAAWEIFEQARTAGAANDGTYCALVGVALRTTQSDFVERVVEELFHGGLPTEGRAGILSARVAWLAARSARPDWLARLSKELQTPAVAFAFALRSGSPNAALNELGTWGDVAYAARLLLRYRLSHTTQDWIDLSEECHRTLNAIKPLDEFSRVRIAETRARCFRRLGYHKEAAGVWSVWEGRASTSLENQAMVLAEMGRDMAIDAIVRTHSQHQALQGARHLVYGWSLAKNGDLHRSETLWAAAEALGGFGDVGHQLGQSHLSPATASSVRSILRQGALDGRTAVREVLEFDLPDDYLEPAKRGIEFLQTLRQSTNTD